MTRLLFMLFLLACSPGAYAQKTDSVVQYRYIESSFTDRSKLTAEKQHYEYTMVRLHTNDVVLISYSSRDFVEALMVRDSLGNEGTKEDDSTSFNAMGSNILLPFKAPADGPYYFVFMTREPRKTGKFKAHIFTYNSRNNHITTKSPFCDKLKYILANAGTGFEFLKDQEEQGPVNTYFTTSVVLLPDATTQVNHDIGATYSCAFAPATDLAAIKKKCDELETNITKCLADHKKKIYKPEDLPVVERKNFVRRVEFTLSGTDPKDINPGHALTGIKDKITLQLDKDHTGKYHLRLEIE